jgi:acyl-CoA thioesterase FadM
MSEIEASPGLFTDFSCRIPASVIDYNGHMNDAAYAQVLTDANEVFLDALGLSAAYRKATACSMYTVEITIKFLREVGLDALLRAESRLASHDAKRLRLHTVLVSDDGSEVATGDSLYLHVDTSAGRVVAFPDDRMAELDRVQAAHDAVPLER